MTSIPISNSNSVPVLYIEESIKRVRSSDEPNPSKYDTDWRMYIAYRYGKFVFCGTRQPVPTPSVGFSASSSCKNKSRLRRKEKKNKAGVAPLAVHRWWPVISLSFDNAYDTYSYALSLIGASKVNTTLYVSSKSGTELDEMFAHPSRDNFDTFDAERSNRRMELVGYDRVNMSAAYYGGDLKNSNIVKQMLANLICMGTSSAGMGISFTCSSPVHEQTLLPSSETQTQLQHDDQYLEYPQCDHLSHASDTHDVQYDDYYDYVHSNVTGTYTKTFDYPT